MDENRARLWEVAARLGMEVRPDDCAPPFGCPWTGLALCGYGDPGTGVPREASLADLWHEIGHYLVACTRGQSLRGWGMSDDIYDGSDPGGPACERHAEEPDASAIGIWCQHVLGQDCEGARLHADEHGWKDSKYDRDNGLAGAVEHLLKLGVRPGRHIYRCERRVSRGRTVKRRVIRRLRGAGFTTPWG